MKKDVKTIQRLVTKWVVYKDKESLESLKNNISMNVISYYYNYLSLIKLTLRFLFFFHV